MHFRHSVAGVKDDMRICHAGSKDGGGDTTSPVNRAGQVFFSDHKKYFGFDIECVSALSLI